MHLIEIDFPWIACVIMHLIDDGFVYAIVLDMLITQWLGFNLSLNKWIRLPFQERASEAQDRGSGDKTSTYWKYLNQTKILLFVFVYSSPSKPNTTQFYSPDEHQRPNYAWKWLLDMVDRMMGKIYLRCMWVVIHLSMGLPLLKNTLNSIDRVMRPACLVDPTMCHHFPRSLMLRVLGY